MNPPDRPCLTAPLLLVAALALALLVPVGDARAQAAPLQAPPGYQRAAGGHPERIVEGECPDPPPAFDGLLDFPSKYQGSGPARDQLNAEADAAYRERTRAITDSERGLVSLVQYYFDSGHPDRLHCALSWYRQWAEADALLGAASTHTGRAVRKWALATLASSWLQLKQSSSQPLAGEPVATRQVERWLAAIADQVVREWDREAPTARFNNHYYWSAWAVMATAVALDRRDLFDWSLAIYRRFSRQIDAAGYLPNELSRRSRALGYHNYALAPMAMVAAFGRANGVDLAALDGLAIRRLASRVLSGIRDPASFAARTGRPQETAEFADLAARLAWLEPYCYSVDCSPRTRTLLLSLRPLASTRLGGDLSRVFGPLPPRSP